MPISPSAGVSTYIVDLPSRLLAHVYDDRGMDVVAMERGPLQSLHAEYRPWLLDYDIDRMDATFAGV
jgi:hypothetical protein